MTLYQTRTKPGEYSSVHQETGRTFSIFQHPKVWNWYAVEKVNNKDVKYDFGGEIWSKKVLLSLLEEMISNPPKPVEPVVRVRKVIIPKEPTPRMKPIKVTQFISVNLLGENEWGVTKGLKHPRDGRVFFFYQDEGGWWYCKQIGQDQLIATSMFSKSEAMEELQLYVQEE